MTPPALDAAALARLQQLDPDGSHGTVERVLRTYESSLARHLAEIREALFRADMARLHFLAHTCKSASLSIGALAFGRLCAREEHELGAGRSEQLAPRIEALLAEGERALEAVRAMLRP